ncbi:Phosphocarrier protein HPr /phosphoenolpyruvate--protein phosphotransferase /dihydroxyacetone kinase DhaM subunit [Alkalispirochaeta americana]|uniref:Phosphocarrier protein HPr /phosphoenolpyruvate--protein phosphotransferase /dihydroxyacetone kinase DhaM subunit n=1 Tax=Alkalispirochaeta americana TaxID=159291 RepID=A0A1N6VNS7_9SPIO|nr:phosphoenolpyruvate--protein phosphotransferase [Alkalispirochaeta americana]SIQ79485.1 Phosphocarrier protein HPr /phosphoenolpyruvate--protein phosphotransferase /dihydroxyacetone kinase DhaM subunit [Alkalispirochaeta americana]
MVGLVIVSHSRLLAEAVLVLLRGVSSRSIPLACAGGTGQDHQDLGTDAMEIMEAIQSVDSPEGVLVLMDLGSAILSAETALEFLEGSLAGPVKLAPAPLVEGGVAAAVQIGLGADLDTVLAEAMEALSPKLSQLGSPVPEGGGLPESGHGTDLQESRGGNCPDQEVSWVTGTFRIATAHGLHARPAARLVQTLGRYAVQAQIKNPGRATGWVNAGSLNRVTTLQVTRGQDVEVRCSGQEAREALQAVAELVAENFGEPLPADNLPADNLEDHSGEVAEVLPKSSKNSSPSREMSGSGEMSGAGAPVDAAVGGEIGVIQGIPASPGLGLGPAAPLALPAPVFPEGGMALEDLREKGFSAVERGIREVVGQLHHQAALSRRNGRKDQAEITEAHALLLADPELLEEARRIAGLKGCPALEAFWRAAQEVAESYLAMEDTYLQARGIDMRDVAIRLVAHVAPDLVKPSEIPQNHSVLVADDLLPSQTMSLEADRVAGIVTLAGSASSHAAIIARGLGIPMVAAVPLPPGWEGSLAGSSLVIDGTRGTVELHPSQERCHQVQELIRHDREEAEALRREAAAPAVLAGGELFPVYANVATLADARLSAASGAEGVGLLRTEFLFLGASSLPDEEAQLAALRDMAEPFGNHPVTVRLLDIGGDKEVSALDLPGEANPFLGVRGVRLLLQPRHRDLFQAHLRAILRLAAERPLRIMIPMVSLVEEIRGVQAELALAREALRAQGVPCGGSLPLGIMVETPAAVFAAATLARLVDFMSIGTNDLTQYVMAAERGNAAVSALGDGLHPAVLAAISQTVQGANGPGVPVSVCGELGSDAQAVPILVGLGIQSVSVNAASVAPVKRQLRGLCRDRCRELAQEALRQDVAGANRRSFAP